jgi:hypothetical protein
MTFQNKKFRKGTGEKEQKRKKKKTIERRRFKNSKLNLP